MNAEQRKLIVVGGGEHARVVIEAAQSRQDIWKVIGFTDPMPCEETSRRTDVPHIGGDEGFSPDRFSSWYVLGVGGIGVSAVRHNVVRRYSEAKARWAAVIHSDAIVSENAEVGAGTVVFAGAIVNSGAKVGEHCVINTGAIVEHDVVVGSFSQVGPGAVIGGGTVIGAGSYLGLGCRIRDHICIGNRVLIGMGAVVVASFEDELALAGVPARPISKERASV